MSKAINEYDLVIKFKEAKERLETLKEAKIQAEKEFADAESQLIERLREEGKDATARYDGLGYIGISRPAVYASFLQENKDDLFKFLRSRKRQDLIQETVNARSLSSYVKEMLDVGKEIPQCINYYLKVSARFYAEKQ